VRPIEQQIILITGATDGLGRAVASELAGRGATLLLHGRSEERGKRTLTEIKAQTGNHKLKYYRADFESLSDVRVLAERIEAEQARLDVLLNNAALGIDPVRRVTADGHESTFQVDYLAPYMLSYLLETLLITSAPSRIVNVASAGQAPINFDDIMLERSYDGMQAYCQAKLADVMLTIDQAAGLSGTGVTVNCVHPAFNMPTKIVTPMFTPQSEIADGVRSTVRLISDPSLDNVTGRYFDQTQAARALPEAYDERARARLRAVAEQLTGVPRHRSSSAPDCNPALARAATIDNTGNT
jgi:NAD(P)-dependent dehydrogenase (short-subunit alcohol dehydrogenase family)